MSLSLFVLLRSFLERWLDPFFTVVSWHVTLCRSQYYALHTMKSSCSIFRTSDPMSRKKARSIFAAQYLRQPGKFTIMPRSRLRCLRVEFWPVSVHLNQHISSKIIWQSWCECRDQKAVNTYLRAYFNCLNLPVCRQWPED